LFEDLLFKHVTKHSKLVIDGEENLCWVDLPAEHKNFPLMTTMVGG
jgi:hypothetical protein